MKVTIVNDVLINENNGINVATMNLVRSLKSKGHEVKILCADKKKEGIEGYHIAKVRNFGPFNGYVRKNEVVLAKPSKKIVMEAVKDADVVHVITPFTLGKHAAQIAKKLNIPVTAGFHVQAENVSNHFSLMGVKFFNNFLYKSFYKKLYKHCDAIHYPTEFIRDIFENVIGETNSYVISNGVNNIFKKIETEKPEELKDKFVILFIGRYSKEKSHDVLVKAVANSKYKDKIQLIFAGAGPQKDNIEKLAKKLLPIQPMFKFFSRDELVKTINYSDLYVHPAEVEIEAIACLEAISCGLVPVIANSPKCATKSFALDEKNLFKNRNFLNLAEKIDYWIDHPKEKEKYSKAYLGYATRFEQDYCMNKMEEMLLETVKNYKK